MTYFDAVLDSNCMPVANGTREEIVELLKLQPSNPDERYTVVVGETLQQFTVAEYLKRFGGES